MAGSIICPHAPRYWVLLHLPHSHRKLPYIVHPAPSDKTNPTVSLKHSPSCPYPYHAGGLPHIPRSHRLHPPTTHTTPITRNRGECHLCDSPGEPRPRWRGHHRLHQACPAGRSARASCHPRVAKSRRVARFARARAINGTCSLFSYQRTVMAELTTRARAALGYIRAYIYSRRSYRSALCSRLLRTVLAQGYLRRFRLMRLLDWCLIGASLRAPPLRWRSSGCAGRLKSCKCPGPFTGTSRRLVLSWRSKSTKLMTKRWLSVDNAN
jgi:hypothetical protein